MFNGMRECKMDYRCRRCGNVYFIKHRMLDSSKAHSLVTDMAMRGRTKIIEGLNTPSLHYCEDGGLGIADFIGVTPHRINTP